jgi:DNA-directed RNA polymerase subunit L
LADNELVILLEMCILSSEKVEFMRYVITPDSIDKSEDKIEEFKESQAAKLLRDVQSFLRLPNFYRQFFMNFSKICRYLTESTKGDSQDWRWMSDVEEFFEALKERFTTAPNLSHFDLTKLFIL